MPDEYQIIKLDPVNYDKCRNIWDMKSDARRIEMAKRFYDQIISGNRVIFVYIENGEYLGEGSVVFDQNDTDYTIPGQRIYLSRMVTKPEYRGKGIGGKILNYLFGYARSLGYSEMSVGVNIDNYRARWLYEKNGFMRLVFLGEDRDGRYVKLVKEL